ncbi:MAG: hypothetical protein ABR956_17380 [Terracidiphilus sp.]|jgi:hypothetical protein
MIDPAQLLSNRIVAIALRVVLGSYVIYMARKFYADPLGYFRRSARGMVDLPRLEPIVRGLACFCLWGGCFILATVVAVQLLGLHGNALVLPLIALAAFAAWLLLPADASQDTADRQGLEKTRRPR